MICFVATNFNNAKYSKEYFASLKAGFAEEFTVVFVDNASTDADYDSLAELAGRREVVLIRNEKNVGYFEGLNVGIRYVRENFPEAKYLVVGNNDLVFPADFEAKIQECQSVLEKYPVVSPNIRTLDGVAQNPHVIAGISKKREFIYDLYNANYNLAQLILWMARLTQGFTDRKDELQHDIAQEIYQGYGACYILGPRFFEHFNELWAPTFLMYEEFFLAKQLEDKGFKTYYEPRIVLTHHCHASTATLPGKFRWRLSREAHKEYRKYVKTWR